MDSKKVYPHSFEVAAQNGESQLYHESAELNRACVEAIDEAILACNYETYRYKFLAAVKPVADRYGFERVNWVLAGTIREHERDGRYSEGNKEWARGIPVPREKYSDFVFQTHPAVLDGFVSVVRKEHVAMLAQAVGGYEKSHRMAERNRLTLEVGADVFAPKPGITEKRLTERYGEIMEKKAQRQSKRSAAAESGEKPSVVDQIRAAREAPQTPSASKREKKTPGQEL